MLRVSAMKLISLMMLAGVILSTSAIAGDRRKSLDEAVSEARDRFRGRVLSAETDRRGGRESYNIRILTDDGKVKRLQVDPESGRFERRKQR